MELGGESASGKKKEVKHLILHCNQDGSLIGEGFEFSPSPNAPGMLSYDPTTDSLWANPYGEPTLYRISCETGAVKEKLKNGKGIGNTEGIAYDPFDGTFWLLDRRHLYHVKRNKDCYELIAQYPNPSSNCPENRAAFDKLVKLKVVGADWSFASLSAQKGTITKTSGGLLTSPLRRSKRVVVEGSLNNDGLFRVLEMDDKTITVEGIQGASVMDEPAGRPITVSLFIRGADEGVAVDPVDHTIWINTDVTKGGQGDMNRCWHLDPLGTYKPEKQK